MVNLRVYDQGGTPYYIDLYDTEPVKLNFSIEDITSTDAKSTFSRVFRVPSTTKNNEFFANAFLIDGIDYDVTVKVPAEIEVGGAFFRSGHIRLQNIYVNQEQDRIDYELLFLGETRDFSSLIGEKTLCELNGALYQHSLNWTSVVQSWQAFPQGPSGIGGLYAGDLLYPLVDYGNSYDQAGNPLQPDIATVGPARFTLAGNPLTADRFKPMMRAKAVIDLIFAQTPYTYSSTFLNSVFFKKIYVSAWGNQAQVTAQTTQTANQFQAVIPGQFNYTGTLSQQIQCNQVNYDANNNYNESPFPLPGFAYTAPLAGVYTFTLSAQVQAIAQPSTGSAFGCLQIWKNGTLATTGTCVSNSTGVANLTITLAPGDYIQAYINWSPNIAFGSYFSDVFFTCTGAPGLVDPTFLLDCEYKQIDFLRDILKLFRCVMSPDKDNPNNFIIEPWINYIGTGQIYDWTDKVDRTKDFQIEPLFYTQTDELIFSFTEDEDWLNKYHQDAYKQVYGELIFDSGNELLTDTRDVTVGFAPTPTTQVEGLTSTDNFIIPQPHTHDDALHLPIKPVTRILFYNGLQPTGGVTWYGTDGTTTYSYTNYPQVSYQEGATPGGPLSSGLNINWDRWFSYYGTAVPGYNSLAGQSLFERYWSSYIASLYNKFSRRVTCYIILNSVDLQTFSFDDVIFIDGVYYIPEKIVDAPIGDKASVKVQLIKYLDFRPTIPPAPPAPVYYYEIAETDCDTTSSTRLVMQSSTILTPGTWIRTQGDPKCYVVIGQSPSQIWTKIYQQSFPNCLTCATPAPPENVYLVQQYGDPCPVTTGPQISVSHTSALSVGDTVKLVSLPGCYRVMGPSAQPPTDQVLNTWLNCATCLESTPITYYYLIQACDDPTNQRIISNNTQLVLGSACTIIGDPNCYEIMAVDPGPANATLDLVYNDCKDCQDLNPPTYYYQIQLCEPPFPTQIMYSPYLIQLNSAVRIDTDYQCWEVIQGDPGPATCNVVQVYNDCIVCQANPPIQEQI